MSNETRSTGKVICTVISVLVIGICIVVPVWQSAVNAQLVSKISNVQAEIFGYETSRMRIEADIAKRTTPEYIVEAAIRQNINFSQIAVASL